MNDINETLNTSFNNEKYKNKNKIIEEINKWSNSIRNTPIKDLGMKIKILKISIKEFYRVELVSFCELREFQNLSRPFYDTLRLKRNMKEQDIDIWSSQVNKPNNFIEKSFDSEISGSETYWFASSLISPETDKKSAYLLPAFDEFLISYKDRSASLPSADFKKAVSENGIFRPVIVVRGQVRGLWKRTIRKDKVIIETELFEPGNKSLMNQIGKGINTYGNFLEKEIELRQIKSWKQSFCNVISGFCRLIVQNTLILFASPDSIMEVL